jgi:hypothetical protein
MMKITPVSTVLKAVDFDSPTLNALVPNENNFTVLLMQPRGQIEASTAGVRNRDRNLARRQFGCFLEDARQTRADLVITPEYSMPWETLVNAMKAGTVPGPGKLWAIGCESIRYSELEALKQDLAPFATMLYEPLQADAARFTDPLAYVFLAPPTDGNGAASIVVLVQFKTCPKGDSDHFESNGLQRGTRIYQFGGIGPSLKLISLICSDAFKFLDADAMAIYDRALVIHIQLNPKPRHEQFRLYRDRLLRLHGDQTELICLNWARDVEEWCGEKAKMWNNISASAWYLKPDKFDERDATLGANHRRGLYYTWLQPLFTHALFFNYKPATYLLQTTKVAHIGVPAAISRRRGPQLTKTSVWDDAATAWVEQVAADDGFSALVGESGQAKHELKRIADDNPIAAERILALCAGEIGHDEDWHSVRNLDSCVIGASEVIYRITFCQDTDEKVGKFRVARLKRCGNLWDVLKTKDKLPAALSDFRQEFRFDWELDFPHQNALSASGKRATLIYMGEESGTAQVEAIYKYAAAFLQRGFSDPNESHNARQRLAVWYRGDGGKIELYSRDRFSNYSSPGDAPEFDIGRET